MMKSQDTLQYLDDFTVKSHNEEKAGNKMYADDPTVQIHEITTHDGVHRHILSVTRLAPTASRTSRIIPPLGMRTMAIKVRFMAHSFDVPIISSA